MSKNGVASLPMSKNGVASLPMSKNGVASLAYVPAIHVWSWPREKDMDARHEAAQGRA
jgi:hypothetical protein